MSDKSLEFRIWQNKLYNLQCEAPTPHLVPCNKLLKNRPPQYGLEYHGPISRQETEKLLQNSPDGSYLIRDSQRAENSYTLVIWFDRVAKNYMLFYDNVSKQHYVGEVKFDTIELLVADGLIHFYVETRGADVLQRIAEANTYETTPFYKVRYHTFNAQAADSSLIRKADFKVPTGDRPVPSPLMHIQASQRPSSPVMRIRPHRRQSLDSEFSRYRHCNRNNARVLFPKPDTIGLSIISDGLSLTDTLETRQYREYPPVPSHNHNNLNEADPQHLQNSSSFEMQASCLKLGSQGENSMSPNITDPATQQLRADEGSSISKSSSSSSVCTTSNRNFPQSVRHQLVTSKPSVHSPTESTIHNGGLHNQFASLKVSGSVQPPYQPEQQFSSKLTSDNFNYEQNDEAMRNLQARYNLPVACLEGQLNLMSDIKPHTFKLHTYRGPHWCDYCTHFIWGLVAQGMKCSSCGFQAHKRCADRVPHDCLPDVKQIKRVFGVDLTSLTRAENKVVPTILIKCIHEIERRGGLDSEGLYRIPGYHELVEELRADFDKDSELADISETRARDVNVLTSLIKLFLRQLPVPLITYEAYPDLIEIMRDSRLTEKDKLEALKICLTRLPVAHYESLRYFIYHIYRVSQHADVNMMKASNLAIVLAPSLMSSSYTDPISCLAGTKFEHALVELLIRECAYLIPPLERRSQSNTNLAIMNNIPQSPEHQPQPHNHRHSQVFNMPSTTTSQDNATSQPSNIVGTPSKKWGFLKNRTFVDGRPSNSETNVSSMAIKVPQSVDSAL